MPKKFRPITPSMRQLVLPSDKELTKSRGSGKKKVKPTKSLLVKKTRTNGRNNLGRITCRHRGGGYATLRMPSGEVRLVPETCRATFGAVSNSEHSLRVDGKAGRVRWKGIRPTVRGTAMNPVDHPHGGGEGRHNGYIPRSPWGKETKGMKTRNKRKSTKMIVQGRKKRG